MADDDLSRSIGQLEGEIKGVHIEIRDLKQGALDARDQLKDHSEETAKKLNEITETLSQAKGGWKVLVIMGSAVGGVAGFGLNLLLKLKGGG